MIMDALTKFDHIAIQFTTGNDNLRSNSELTADVYNKTGAPLAADLLLHEQDGGTWDNNSTSPRIVVSMPVETEVSSLDRIDVVLRSHNDAFQNDDEWHVNGVLVSSYTRASRTPSCGQTRNSTTFH
jgi:hypothetical protein